VSFGSSLGNTLSRNTELWYFVIIYFALIFTRRLLKDQKLTVPRTKMSGCAFSAISGNLVKEIVYFFSQVGDQSIDLPEADVVIQVALMHGGRMQEGQRIGRIQRPQPGKLTAYFYSLVSDGTKEVEFAKKRRNFLQDHGYQILREKRRTYEKYLTDNTAHVVSESTQQGIIAAVQAELNKREDERRNGKPNRDTSGLKRKRTNDSQKQLKKKLKLTKH